MKRILRLKMLMVMLAALLAAISGPESHAIGLTEYPDTGAPSAGEDSSGGEDSQESYGMPDEDVPGEIVPDGYDRNGYGPDGIYGSGAGSYTVQGTLQESYNAQYDLYEESLNNLFFFYSNVSNGEFATRPVFFDIPSNLSYTLEQGGIPIPYNAGEEIREIGSYLLRVSGDYGGTVYRSTFHFTIREEMTEADTGETLQPEEMVWDPSEEISQENLDAIVEAAGAEMEAQQPDIPAVRAGTAEETLGMAQNFHIEADAYCYTLKTGTAIKASVPNGAIVNGGVSVQMPPSVTAEVYLNGSLYEIAGMNFSEAGTYRIVFQENTLAFATSYPSEREYPMLVFRIVDGPLGAMGIYNAPLHTEIIRVAYEGEDVYESGAEGEEATRPLVCYRMGEDGTYCFTMRDEASGHTYSLDLTRDTQAPQFDVSIKNGRADIVYQSSDIASYALTVDGVPQTEFSPTRMEGKGNYELSVIDTAGNEATAGFVLAEAVNYASLAAVAILLLMVSGILLGAKKIRVSFRTR